MQVLDLSTFVQNIWQLIAWEREDKNLSDDAIADALADIVVILRDEIDTSVVRAIQSGD